MADGTQREFNIPRHQPATRLRPGEIAVDLFAGGGGASVALEAALQRQVDIAINHDEFAVGMHAANHPLTRHLREDVWVADPKEIAAGRPVGWLHASPDCTHFSQARGGQPRSRKTRSLSWVVVKWAGRLHGAGLAPRYISLENVEQILTWGPLVAKRCKATGRVLKMDGSVAGPGEVVPVGNQQLVPDKKRAGKTWAQFVAILRGFGYDVEWKKVVAADHGAGTSRKRLFLVARLDGQPIVWPAPTHGPGRAHPYVTAADCIDWSIPGKSIFGRKKDLVDATMRRIARGIKRYVLDAAEPFIVPATIIEHANASREAAWSTEEPLRTQCANVKGGHFALAAATLVQTGYGERPGQAPRVPGLDKPVGTLVDGQKHGVVSATLEHAGAGPYSNITRQRRLVAANMVTLRGDNVGAGADDPVRVISAGGEHHALVSAFIEQAYGGGPNGNPAPARAANEPLGVITGAGSQQRVVEARMAPSLSPEQEAGALRVAAFLIRYYGEGGQWAGLDEPVDTITTKDRLALVTVHVRGVPYVIVDITLRMLTPPELYRAQGFPFFRTGAKIRLWRDHTTRAADGQARRSANEPAQHVECGSAPSSRPAQSSPAAVHALIDFARNVLVLRNPERSSSSAITAGEFASFPLPTEIAAFAPLFAHPCISLEHELRTGKAGARRSGSASIRPGRGDKPASESGVAIKRIAAGAASGMNMVIEGSRFTTSLGGLSSPTSASTLETLSSFVADAIGSCIRDGTLTGSSFDVELEVDNSYIIDRTADGRKLTVSQQVRMVGNSVSPPPLFAIVDANLDQVEEPLRLAA